MGNEITPQNTQYGNYNYMMPNYFGGNMLTAGMGQLNGTTDYSNDMFAPDYIKQPLYNTVSQNPQNGSIFTNTQNQIPQNYTQAFTGSDNTNEQVITQNNDSPQNIENETNTKTNIGKTLGTIAGLSVPFLSSSAKVFGGAKFTDVFKFKELGLKAGALALAGWCTGSIIDAFLNNVGK